MVSIEQHVDWISTALVHADRDLVSIEAKKDSRGQLGRALSTRSRRTTLYPQPNSWYIGRQYPGQAADLHALYRPGVADLPGRSATTSAAKGYEGVSRMTAAERVQKMRCHNLPSFRDGALATRPGRSRDSGFDGFASPRNDGVMSPPPLVPAGNTFCRRSAVAVCEHAADRMIALHVHAHASLSHNSSRMWKWIAFAHDELPLAVHIHGFPDLAFHRPRRVGEPRRRDLG